MCVSLTLHYTNLSHPMCVCVCVVVITLILCVCVSVCMYASVESQTVSVSAWSLSEYGWVGEWVCVCLWAIVCVS